MSKKLHIHILGIGGTFMGNLALLARQMGYRVTGSDGPLYPPMSTQLQEAGIEIYEGYDTDSLKLNPDQFIVGNALSRGKPIVEALLSQRIRLWSGPEWLSQHILDHKSCVLGVAGTHGKTTTTSLLAWILTHAGYQPGFLIGGVTPQFKSAAELGHKAPDGKSYFVLECDEYDSAFFDKRSKFVHYRPNVTILNNLEFDHADIFNDLAAIEDRFHHLVRVLPSEGLIVYPDNDAALNRVLKRGCWTPTATIGKEWSCAPLTAGNQWIALQNDKPLGTVNWTLLGTHNQSNGIAAIAAANHIGISPSKSIEALNLFQGVKRRMEVRHSSPNLTVYDDFAHHPTAIETTLQGLRAKVGKAPIIAVLDFRSNTMKKGTHQGKFKQALQTADAVFLYRDPAIVKWDIDAEFNTLDKPGGVHGAFSTLLDSLKIHLKQYNNTPAHILGMSNGNFEDFYACFIINK